MQVHVKQQTVMSRIVIVRIFIFGLFMFQDIIRKVKKLNNMLLLSDSYYDVILYQYYDNTDMLIFFLRMTVDRQQIRNPHLESNH